MDSTIPINFRFNSHFQGLITKAYSEPSAVNYFCKRYILDVWLGSKYLSTIVSGHEKK